MNENLKIRLSSAGIHIFNRSTGINVLIDEVSLPTNKWSIAPCQVSVALTNSCDMVCPHCYAPKHPAELPYEKLTKWLYELDSNGCIGVGFGGGEPTLYPKLADICDFAAKETNLAVTMTTHAHNLSNQLINGLSGNIHFIRISMDGVGCTYESIRNRSFKSLLDRIQAIKTVMKFGLNYVVNSKTIGDLDQAVELAHGLGASELLLLPEEPIGRGKGIDAKTLELLQKWVWEYQGCIQLTISEGNSEGLPICNPLREENGLSAFAHIDASGFLKRTSYERSGIYIKEDGVIEAIEKLKSTYEEEIT